MESIRPESPAHTAIAALSLPDGKAGNLGRLTVAEARPTPAAQNAPARQTVAASASPASSRVIAPANAGVDMTPSLLPVVYAVVIGVAWLFPGPRQGQIRKRLSDGRDYFLGLALIPVVLVLLVYFFNRSSWPIYLAWSGLVVATVLALIALFGPERESVERAPELHEDPDRGMD